MVATEKIKDLISRVRSASNTIENHLGPSLGNGAVGLSGLLPGAGVAIYANAVNNLRPISYRLNDCVSTLESLLKEVEGLENNLVYWKNKDNDLRDDNEGLKEEYKTTKDDLMRERIQNTQTKTRLEQQLINANSNSAELTRQLQGVKNELGLVRTEKENQLTQKNNEIKVIEGTLNERNNQVREKERELELLQNQKSLTQEELLTEKLRFEKGNLDLFSSQLRVNPEQINSLSKYHEKLFIARKTRDQVNIDLHDASIALTKREFTEQGISMINIQEILRKCEKIAELSWELDQLQQQFQAQQEIPTN